MIYCCYYILREINKKGKEVKTPIYQTRFESKEQADKWVLEQDQKLEPFVKQFTQVKKIALVSGGRESSAMVFKVEQKYGKDFFDRKEFADTGDDPTGRATVDYLNQRHDWNIQIVFKKDEDGKQVNIVEYYENKIIDNEPEFTGHALPSHIAKDCSNKFKISPIMNDLKETYGNDTFFDLYMGLSHSIKEIGRMRNTTGVLYSAYVYPLILEFQLDREMCGQVCLENMGFIPERSWCQMCIEKTFADWREMWKKNPKKVLEIIKFEESSKFMKKYGRGLATIPIKEILKIKELPQEQTTLISCGCVNFRLDQLDEDEVLN